MLPATPAKEKAYAGPTFQASPAPSSLPVPKFFSRSVPNVAAQQKSLGARMAGEKTPDGNESSPEPDVVAPARDAQLSPLDMFFKADKAEKERTRSTSLQSPEMLARRPPPMTEPRNPFQQSSGNILVSEPILSPRTLPHPDRPPPPQRMPSAGSNGPAVPAQGDREVYTKSLKDLLFNFDSTPPSTTPPNGTPFGTVDPRNRGSPFETPSPFQRSTSGPSTPTPSAEQQNHYSLHYGNRNLSPLFQAARRPDTPPSRPSGLRQHVAVSDQSPTASRSQQPIDPDSFSRQYLDHHIRASNPTLPPLPLSNATKPSTTIPEPVSQHSSSANNNTSQTNRGGSHSNAGSQGQDRRTMEDDLKRMLKINVLSN
jgi:hypothetical protein